MIKNLAPNSWCRIYTFWPKSNNLKNISIEYKEELRNYLRLGDCYSFNPFNIDYEIGLDSYMSLEFYISEIDYKKIKDATTLEKEHEKYYLNSYHIEKEYKDGYICKLEIPQRHIEGALEKVYYRVERRREMLALLYVIGITIMYIVEYRVFLRKK